MQNKILTIEYRYTPLLPKCLPKQAETIKHNNEHHTGKKYIYIYFKKNIYEIYINLSKILLSNNNNLSKKNNIGNSIVSFCLILIKSKQKHCILFKYTETLLGEIKYKLIPVRLYIVGLNNLKNTNPVSPGKTITLSCKLINSKKEKLLTREKNFISKKLFTFQFIILLLFESIFILIYFSINILSNIHILIENNELKRKLHSLLMLLQNKLDTLP